MAISARDISSLSLLLDQALDLEPVRREAWLASLAPEHRHLEALLREMMAGRGGTSTGGPARLHPWLDAWSARDETVPVAGDRIGAYELRRPIGRGGMGEVWLAQRSDGTFRRQVALKLPRLAWGEGLARRMAREREIGALLEHPHIARLYDAGVDQRGRPYLCLEYVDGQPIDAWCAARKLGVAARLRLVAQVARAVAYAHGRLVVHRDLKPSNVLVTTDGQTHLLDFGIAKLLDEAGGGEGAITREHGRHMTLHYASPEQMRNEVVTVQSDVYSLGVLLHVLLTGQTPYRPQAPTLASLDAAMRTEPPLASSRLADGAAARELAGDAETIVAKALRIDPAQRYANADALADDIERYLARRPILARPPSLLHHARLFLRRHPRASVATALGCAVVVTFGATLWQQRGLTDAEHARADMVRDFMIDLIENVDESQKGSELAAERILESGARLAREKFDAQPRLLGELLGEFGRMFEQLGAADKARGPLQESLALLAANAPESDAALNKTRVLMATLALQDNDLPAARRLAVRARDACGGGADIECAKARAYASGVISNVDARQGLVADALENKRRSIVDVTIGFGALHAETALAWLQLGIAARNAGQLVEARRAIDNAVRISSRVALKTGDRISLQRTDALLQMDLGRYAQAAAAFQRLLAETRDVGDGDERALQLRLLATAQVSMGDAASALQTAERALALAGSGTARPEALFARQVRARSASLSDRSAQALADIGAVVDGLAAAGYPARSLEVLRARRWMSEMLARAGQLERARDVVADVVAALEADRALAGLELGLALDLQGCIERDLGRAAAAQALHLRARELLATQLATDHPLMRRNDLYRALAEARDRGGDDARAAFGRRASDYARTLEPASVWQPVLARGAAVVDCGDRRDPSCLFIL